LPPTAWNRRLAERASIRVKRAKRRLLEFLSFGAVRVCVSEEFGGFRLQAVMLLLLLAFSLVREPADSGVDGKALGYCHNGGVFSMIVHSTEEWEQI
jgi:hypothetical protein